jgi:hypothetical protein
MPAIRDIETSMIVAVVEVLRKPRRTRDKLSPSSFVSCHSYSPGYLTLNQLSQWKTSQLDQQSA